MQGILLALFIVISSVLLATSHDDNWERGGPMGRGQGGYRGHGGYHMGYHMSHHGQGGYGHRRHMGPGFRFAVTNVRDLVDNRPAPRWAAGPICHNGLRRHSCYLNPCMGARCTSHPQYVCVPDYCGGCKRKWRDTNGEDVDCPSYNISFNHWRRRQRAA